MADPCGGYVMIDTALRLIRDGVRTAAGLGTLTTRHEQILNRSRIPNYQLECDGHKPFWLTPGVDYTLTHNGTDWQVQGGDWGRARLTTTGRPIQDLPTDRGLARLVPGETYLVVALPHRRWELLRLHQ